MKLRNWLYVIGGILWLAAEWFVRRRWRRAVCPPARPPEMPQEWDLYCRVENGPVSTWVYFREYASDPREAVNRIRNYYPPVRVSGDWSLREVRLYPAETHWIREAC